MINRRINIQYKNLFLFILMFLAIGIVLILKINFVNAAETCPYDVVETVAEYNLNDVDIETMAKIKSIVSNENTVSMEIKDNKLVLKKVYSSSPEIKNNPFAVSFIELNPQIKIRRVNFIEALGKMDNANGESDIPDGTYITPRKQWAGQNSGDHVSVGTHVHCNRFNGTSSDHRYWSHFNPKAWVDFNNSDCDYHSQKYHCTMMGSLTGKKPACDGLNSLYHKGVKDCSAWKGGASHKNWPKTCWYRN